MDAGRRIVPCGEPIGFHTRSDVLSCTRRGDLIELDFPATPIETTDSAVELCQALGVTASFVGQSKYDNLVLVESEQVLRGVQPDFSRLRKIPMRGVAVTSQHIVAWDLSGVNDWARPK
jgi:predicted PhzF superfamily epimerase YddE/YHI9